MYVCLCNPTSDREVRSCVRRGACTLSDLQMQLGVAAQCGTCVSAVLDILEEEVRSQGNCSLPIAALRHAA